MDVVRLWPPLKLHGQVGVWTDQVAYVFADVQFELGVRFVERRGVGRGTAQACELRRLTVVN